MRGLKASRSTFQRKEKNWKIDSASIFVNQTSAEHRVKRRNRFVFKNTKLDTGTEGEKTRINEHGPNLSKHRVFSPHEAECLENRSLDFCGATGEELRCGCSGPDDSEGSSGSAQTGSLFGTARSLGGRAGQNTNTQSLRRG